MIRAHLPSPTIPSSIYCLRHYYSRGDIHAVRRQIPPQLRRVLKMNRAHAQLPRALQIQFPVINEQTFVRAALGHFERQFIDSFIGFSNAKIAGTEKSLEFPPQIELLDPAFVQLERFIVDGGKQIFSGCGHVGQNRARFRKFFRLRKNEMP